jgi:hypothetical protein
MTSRPSVPSAVSQRFVSRDLPFAQPLATVRSAVTIRSVSRDTYRSVSRQTRLSDRHRLIFRLNKPFQVEFLGWCSGSSTASIAASSAPLARGLEPWGIQ